jgi:hypothetical protein
MSHEQSETVQLPNGRWTNIYGRQTAQRGQMLKPKYDFEKKDYDTVKEAVAAAESRSKLEGLLPDNHLPKGVTQSPSGDLGQHRQVEATIAGGFTGPVLSASKYFRRSR